MMPAVLKFIFNIGLLSAILFAPTFLLMSHWYRKGIRSVLMRWRRPEASFLTIVYAILSIIFFTIGVSCFFNYWKYQPSGTPNGISPERLRDIGAISSLFLAAMTLVFVSFRMLFVQIITEQGIILNRSFLRVPNVRDVIEWHEVCDYFVVEDYPNATFHITYQREGDFLRASLPVPTHQKQNFSELLDFYLDKKCTVSGYSSIGKRKLSDS
ncbi:MAG: hypothetical protein ACKVTZ_17085 [Bacteroidia bacterium]